MTQENTNVDGRTLRAADLALMKATISPASHAAVLAGEISLQQAKEYGRDGAPDTPATPGAVGDDATGRPRKTREPRPCIACGRPTKGGRFHPGCDAKMFRIAREHLLGERDLTDAQHEYLEVSGKMQKVRERLEAEERKREERIAAKTERQRAREGEAEKRKARAAALSEPGDSAEEQA
jgi:hypothetical protein